VAETIVNRVVHEELEGRGLRPLASPQVTDLKIDEDQPMTFKAVFETLPLVDLPEYKGLPAQVRKPNVAEEDVDKELARLREEAARFDPIEARAAHAGDFALLDVAWKGSEGARGGRDENTMVEVGSADNHPDLNAALVGMSPGETKDVRLVYAEDTPSQRLAGKTVDYTVAMKALKQKLVPAADDDFAKDLGEFDSLDALRARVREDLEHEARHGAEREMRAELMKQLAARVPFEAPASLVEREIDRRIEDFARRLMEQQVDPREAGIDWNAFRDSQREASREAVGGALALDEVARREGLEVTEADVEREVARYGERTGRTAAAVRARLEKEGGMPRIHSGLRREKAIDFLMARATISEESQDFPAPISPTI